MKDKTPAYSYETQAGYVAVLQPAHPLAMKNGRVYGHRVAAYEKHDGVCPDCFWCGAPLEWTDAVVDHLDEDKQNNEASNLVVACSPCNRARGALLPFIAGMRDDALPMFIERIMQYRANSHSRDKQREESKG